MHQNRDMVGLMENEHISWINYKKGYIMDFIYMLIHTYELQDDYGTHEEFKFIGVFTSENKAREVIDILKDKPGFKDHSTECFSINQYILNQVNWDEGFDTYRYKEY